jgi:hypothetical protein
MFEMLLSRFAAACEPQALKMIPTWYKHLDSSTDATGRCVPEVTMPNSITPILLAAFEIVLFIAGIMAVAFVIYGGFLYITSQGEPEKIKNARTTIVNALVGLVIAIMSTAIVNLVAGSVR